MGWWSPRPAGAATRTGLTVRAEHDTGSYPRGIKITGRQMRQLEPQITCHDWRGEWNYRINPDQGSLNLGALFICKP